MFEGDYRVVYHLAPPLLARKDPTTGEPRKMRFGPGSCGLQGPLFNEVLEGNALDPFGYTEERRTERALIREYEQTVERLLAGLTPQNHALAVQIASIPDEIRGFGHIKARSIAPARKKRDELLAALRAPARADAEPRRGGRLKRIGVGAPDFPTLVLLAATASRAKKIGRFLGGGPRHFCELPRAGSPWASAATAMPAASAARRRRWRLRNASSTSWVMAPISSSASPSLTRAPRWRRIAASSVVESTMPPRAACGRAGSARAAGCRGALEAERSFLHGLADHPLAEQDLAERLAAAFLLQQRTKKLLFGDGGGAEQDVAQARAQEKESRLRPAAWCRLLCRASTA